MQGDDQAQAAQVAPSSPLSHVGMLSAPRFSRTKLAFIGILFAVIGGVSLYVALAATTTVTYKGSLSSRKPIASYSLTTGAGQTTVTLAARTKDLALIVRDASGNQVKRFDSKNNSSVNGSFNILKGTYRFEVLSPTPITTTKAYYLTVSYPLRDTANPTAIINSPTSLETVIGKRQINATATDDNKVSKVDFYIGDNLAYTDTDSPYAYMWDSQSVPDGNANITIRSYDTSGNTGQAGVTVNVANTPAGSTANTTRDTSTSASTTPTATSSPNTTAGSPNLVNASNAWFGWDDKPKTGFDTSKAGTVSVTPGVNGIQSYLTTKLVDGATYLLDVKSISGGASTVKLYIRDTQWQWLNTTTTSGKVMQPLETTSGSSVSFVAPGGNDGFIVEVYSPFDGSSSTFSINLQQVTVSPPVTPPAAPVSNSNTTPATPAPATTTTETETHNFTVRSLGSTGEEALELRINGSTVGRWNPQTQYGDYNYIHTGKLPEKVEVAFVNNGYNANKVDKNVKIDYLAIDNLSKYQTEDPGVFYDDLNNSGGVCGDGNRKDENIYCNGKFVYTISGAGSQTLSMSTPDAMGHAPASHTTAPATPATSTPAAPSTPSTPTSMPNMSMPNTNPAGLEALRNSDPTLARYANLNADQVWSQHMGDLTIPGERNYNGSSSQEAQFRASCHYSHLLYDDPIVFPGKPGASHLHMFYGNTGINAYTTPQNIGNIGGGSCQGNELNRTGYWMPALFDGNGKVRVPTTINMYYKTRFANEAVEYPVGLAMIADKQNSGWIGWACYDGSGGLSTLPYIPTNCPNGTLTFAVYFPQCWDGRLDSPDHKSHLAYVNDQNPCPSSHPKRLVQYSLHAYFNVAGQDLSRWTLSSDASKGETRGGSIHADWYGGWNQKVQDVWFSNCIKRWLNCSIGQLGGYPDMLSRRGPGQQYPNGIGDGQYPGPKELTIPK